MPDSNHQLSTINHQLPRDGGGLSDSQLSTLNSQLAGGEGEPSNSPLSTLHSPLPLPSARAAFTLIELLVVIAIIALLAALVMPITGAVNRAKIKSKTRAEMEQLITSIMNYQAQVHVYPPDNPGNPKFINQLYYELSGTRVTNDVYTTLDGSTTIAASTFGTAFGAPVTGFINASKGGNGDEGVNAQKFTKELKSPQIGDVAGTKILVASVGWTGDPGSAPIPGTTLNPWRYNSSNPTNNPGTFDLWVDVYISGKTNRICNWSKEALVQ